MWGEDGGGVWSAAMRPRGTRRGRSMARAAAAVVLAAGALGATMAFLHHVLSARGMGGARLESLAPSVARRGGASLVIAKAVHAALPPVLARAQAPLCASRPHVELDGAVVQAGAGPRAAAPAANAGECCARCTAHRGCNVWVFCREASWCAGQCWLKQAEAGTNPRNVRVRAQGESVPWESGTLDKDWIDPARPLPAVDVSISAIALRTAHGDIVLRLMPDWSLPSVDYLRRMAAGLPTQHDVCTQCEFYRTEVRARFAMGAGCASLGSVHMMLTRACARTVRGLDGSRDLLRCLRARQPGFLLQGVLRGLVPANTVTQKGPKLMERGEVGWAGGGPGPDLFIYLGARPAAHFGHDHTGTCPCACVARVRTHVRAFVCAC